MDNQPLRDERILEAIEACRPGSDDVADPALAYLAAAMAANPEVEDLYERLQRVDGSLAGSFRDVPVPEGLAQRILDRLAGARAKQAPQPETEDAAETPPAEPRQAAKADPKWVSRRWLLAGSGLLAAAAGLFIAVWTVMSRSPEYTEQLVLQEAMDFFREESPEPAYLLSDEDHPPPADYAFSRDMRLLRGIRWRWISGLLDRRGVAYDMPGGGATLYVVKGTVPGLPTRPTLRQPFTTGGYAALAWEERGLLYVLVVRGNSRACQSYFALPGPLT